MEKIINPHWLSGDSLQEFLVEHQDATMVAYQPFLDLVVEPLAGPIALLVIALELFVGVALLTGREIRLGLLVGIFLNMHFLLAGAVNPSAFYLVMQITLIASASAGVLTLTTPPSKLLRYHFDNAMRILGRYRVHPRALLALVPVVVVLPFLLEAKTIHPEHVIDDPALMVVFVGSLVSLIAVLRCALVAGPMDIGEAAQPAPPASVVEAPPVTTRIGHRMVDLQVQPALSTVASAAVQRSALKWDDITVVRPALDHAA